MRVLLSASGTRGDIEPALALALGMREVGAKAQVCAPPDFAGRCAELGVSMVPLGPPIPGLRGAKVSPADLLEYADQWPTAQFDTIPAAAAGFDAVVATGMTEIAARSAAERLGIHYQYASYQPTSLPSPHHPPMPRMPGDRPAPEAIGNGLQWEIDALGWNAQFGTALNSGRSTLGLPPVDDVRDHVVTDRPWLAADPVLAPWTESPGLDIVQTGAWIVPDTRPLPADLAAFLDAGTPPVYIGFGSMRVHNGIARVAIDAARAHNRRVLLSRGWAELSPVDGQSDCMAVGEVNHQALFPRVAAVIHHGGAGTTTTATRAGVPQVVVPQMMDQPYWAHRVTDLGIGTTCEGPAPDLASLSAALDTALTSTTRDRANAIAGMIRTDGATVAAKLLADAIG
ncbi:glycosyltransferase family 1 protein [Nocardia cyriacigeorgica]|uniref:Glycosyltransferase family 1 protein n=1 Tax=Nocardia cyriacigeorgica TaxID=135487 RepID=A0A6P1D681_9NOCA|nr:glycosyltransferase [Nocardia cyriacigeorgica]NEW42133.1 glycosyltransferase family 1 protein [Nocardia cyriacigeorgica]NEW44530.1 glycosyltransferase family 1 protein [Nocardia cyriacigeorgica]NEW53151.1 glycosyltransferase family 1 protein [Nocardia cyriacigeorgica]NEW55910.1 glycosyltransferase family 1 protein [Nocardia cyriacigeorgica]